MKNKKNIDKLDMRAFEESTNQFLYRGIFDRNWYSTRRPTEKSCNCVRGIRPEDQHTLNLMFYTGCKDDNNVEICEGDIVSVSAKCVSNTYIDAWQGIVIYSLGCFSVYNSELKQWSDLDKNGLTIIGNVYDIENN